MPAPTNNKAPGKQKNLTVGGVRIYTTSISGNPQPKFADTTDDNDYDTGTDLVYPSKIKTAVPVTLSVEGYYYKTSTPSALIAAVFAATGPLAVAFSLATGYAHFGGYYDLEDLTVSAETQDVAKISFKLTSNGIVSANS